MRNTPSYHLNRHRLPQLTGLSQNRLHPSPAPSAAASSSSSTSHCSIQPASQPAQTLSPRKTIKQSPARTCEEGEQNRRNHPSIRTSVTEDPPGGAVYSCGATWRNPTHLSDARRFLLPSCRRYCHEMNNDAGWDLIKFPTGVSPFWVGHFFSGLERLLGPPSLKCRDWWIQSLSNWLMSKFTVKTECLVTLEDG